jgi:hypothetical protein
MNDTPNLKLADADCEPLPAPVTRDAGPPGESAPGGGCTDLATTSGETRALSVRESKIERQVAAGMKIISNTEEEFTKLLREAGAPQDRIDKAAALLERARGAVDGLRELATIKGHETFDNPDNEFRAKFGEMDPIARDTAAPFSFFGESIDDILDAIRQVGGDMQDKYLLYWDEAEQKPNPIAPVLNETDLGHLEIIDEKVREATELLTMYGRMVRLIRGIHDAEAGRTDVGGAEGAPVPAGALPGGPVEVRHTEADVFGPGAAEGAGAPESEGPGGVCPGDYGAEGQVAS